MLTLSEDVFIFETIDGEYVIEKRSTAQYFKVGHTVYYVVSLLNEEREYGELLKKCKQAGVSISEELYQDTIDSLSRYGIIKSNEVVRTKSTTPIYFKVRLLTEAQTNAISSKLTFLFHPYIFTALFLLSFAVIVLYVFAGGHIGGRFWGQDMFSVIVSLLTIMLLQIFHEIGHSSASLRYGIRAKEIGMGFLFGLIPVFYSDLTRIWLLPSSQRIIANLGGIYFDFLIGTLCIVIWLLTNIDIFGLYPYLLIGISLRNLNVFLKYDGYWVVADILNSPNLLLESKQAVFSVLFNRKHLPNMTYLRSSILFLYGVLNYTYTVFFVCFILFVYFKDILGFPALLYTVLTTMEVAPIYQQVIDRGVWSFFCPLIFYGISVFKVISFFIQLHRNKRENSLSYS